MLKPLVECIKLVLFIIHDLIHRLKKYLMYLYNGKHEFERICESPCDIYEKTMRIDQWLMRTNCEKIRDYWNEHIHYKTADPNSLSQRATERILTNYRTNHRENTQPSKNLHPITKGSSAIVHLEDGDIHLTDTLKSLTDGFIKVIKHSKRTKLSADVDSTLRDIIYRIICYNLTLVVAIKVASLPYDSSISSHSSKLISLWDNLVRADKSRSLRRKSREVFPREISSEITDRDSIVSSRWSHIGFQGEDPGTDFRGMGLLGLEQLEYLSRRSKDLALDLLERSLNDSHDYPFAIVGINITYNLVCLFKEGAMKHLYYDCGEALFRGKQRSLNIIKTFNDLYVELFLRFDCFWHESKPENILAFPELMDKFIAVIKLDLCNRTFSFKFIY